MGYHISYLAAEVCLKVVDMGVLVEMLLEYIHEEEKKNQNSNHEEYGIYSLA